MPLTQLQNARKKTVGSKQTLKAIRKGQARLVFIAQDAESHVTGPIVQACLDQGIKIIKVDNMRLLGKTCGIEVGCASAAIIEFFEEVKSNADI